MMHRMRMRISKPKKLGLTDLALGLSMGLFGQLYLPISGLGTIAILDIFSYVFGGIVLLLSWGRMGRNVRKTIMYAVLWTIAAVFANLFNFVDARYYFKSVVIIATSITLMSIAFWVLRRDARLYLLYLLGWALGCWIGLYYLKPGTWLAAEFKQGEAAINVLMDKEIYPIVAYALYFSIFFIPTFFVKSTPKVFPIVGCFVAGFYLLFNGGSRSNFGICTAAGLLGIGACYFKKVLIRLLRSKAVFYIILIVSVALVFGVYKYLAESGALGEGEQQKYAAEFADARMGEGGILGRGGYYATIENFLHSPWGVGGTNQRHSVVSNSWNCEGLFGLVFWLFFFRQCFWFLRNRIAYTGRFSCFMAIMFANSCWAAIGSPFGARNIYFTLLIFVALCQDDQYYGYETVFNQ